MSCASWLMVRGTIIYHDNIIAIVSKKLNETQIRYFTYKQELWGLLYCSQVSHVDLGAP